MIQPYNYRCMDYLETLGSTKSLYLQSQVSFLMWLKKHPKTEMYGKLQTRYLSLVKL